MAPLRARPRPTSEGIETAAPATESAIMAMGARPRPTSEGIETQDQLGGRGQGAGQGARPRPTSEGIETYSAVM